MSLDNADLFCSELPCRPDPAIPLVLVAGASGYVGGRLLPELLARGYRVRVLVRSATPDYHQRWPGAEIAVGDALDAAALGRAMAGVHTAYYLIHSLYLGARKFASADIQAAANFRDTAAAAGLTRIIYLGGLGDSLTRLSAHLHSRMAVAEALAAGPVPVTILRAAVIIGSGSVSYEIIKHLGRSVPFFLMPRWARTRCQPIAIRDVIKYLVGVMESPAAAGGRYDIGGDDVLSYEEMILVQAGLFGKRPLVLHLPVSLVRLYAYAVSLLTPVPLAIVRSLLESGGNEVVCRENGIRRLLPFAPLGYKESLLRALSREEQDKIYSRWSDAWPPAHELALTLRELQPPPRYTSRYSLRTAKPADRLFASICRIGGREGWFRGNWMWRLRGALDKLLAGTGSGRGRRSPTALRIHDVVDFWRVEELAADRSLLLRAEMKLPGMAWLEFRIDPLVGDRLLTITAHYQPRGLWGRLYWYFFLPFHFYIFHHLLAEIEKRATPAAGN